MSPSGGCRRRLARALREGVPGGSWGAPGGSQGGLEGVLGAFRGVWRKSYGRIVLFHPGFWAPEGLRRGPGGVPEGPGRAPGRGVPGGVPEGPRGAPGRPRRAPEGSGGQKIAIFEKSCGTFPYFPVPNGRVIKYPKKCAFFAPRGPPGPPAGPREGPRDPLRGPSGPPPGAPPGALPGPLRGPSGRPPAGTPREAPGRPPGPPPGPPGGPPGRPPGRPGPGQRSGLRRVWAPGGRRDGVSLAGGASPRQPPGAPVARASTLPGPDHHPTGDGHQNAPESGCVIAPPVGTRGVTPGPVSMGEVPEGAAPPSGCRRFALSEGARLWQSALAWRLVIDPTGGVATRGFWGSAAPAGGRVAPQGAWQVAPRGRLGLPDGPSGPARSASSGAWATPGTPLREAPKMAQKWPKNGHFSPPAVQSPVGVGGLRPLT